MPFLSPRYPRSLALLYHGQRSQSSPGQVEASEFWDDVWLLETAAEGEPELVWRYVELWMCQEIDLHHADGLLLILPRGRKVEIKVVLLGGLVSSDDVVTSSSW